MASPFLNNIASTTGSAPGTGNFTPNAAAAGAISWTDSIWGVATGWIGLVRYDDGATWELAYGYWNGTAISRPANGFVTSSTGSQLSLTSSAIASLVADGGIVAPHFGMGMSRGGTGIPNGTTAPSALGAAVTVTGTASAANLATTNYLTESPCSQVPSATTANAQCGYSLANICVNNVTAGRGGWQFVARFGTSTVIPTGRRLTVGVTNATMIGVTTDPSALATNAAFFGLDSADTNIQLMTNDGTGSSTKIDTGIPLVQSGWYHAQIWMKPGGGRVFALLVRLDTGAIFFRSTTTDIPGTAVLRAFVLGGLGATTGTAFTMNMGAIFIRPGGW